jgi:hypothetical protein
MAEALGYLVAFLCLALPAALMGVELVRACARGVGLRCVGRS